MLFVSLELSSVSIIMYMYEAHEAHAHILTNPEWLANIVMTIT